MKILRTKASEGGFGEVVEMSEQEIIALLMNVGEFKRYIVQEKDEDNMKRHGEYALEIMDYDDYVE